MKIRLNHPDKDKDGSLDMPSLDPTNKGEYPDAAEEASADSRNAAQSGGDGPRIDDIGVDDLQDRPREVDLEAIDKYMRDRGDTPVFDRSIESLDVGEDDTGVESAGEAGRDEEIHFTDEGQLENEESRVYDESIDGPGTRDLH